MDHGIVLCLSIDLSLPFDCFSVGLTERRWEETSGPVRSISRENGPLWPSCNKSPGAPARNDMPPLHKSQRETERTMLWRTKLDHLCVFEDADLIVVNDSAEAVGDRKDRAAIEDFANHRLR